MIEVNNLSYGYYSHAQVLRDITLAMPSGHIYGLLGKNGVGKSTLLKLLTGTLRGQGDIRIGGLDPRQDDARFLEQVRLVPETDTLFPITVEELTSITAPLYPTFDHALMEEALTEFEVPRGRQLTTLSLGQQKKALIALSLACNTPYLLMDEPTNGMDIPSKSTFRRLVARAADEGKTVVISTHQVDDIDSLIDAVVILENQGVLLSATLDEVGRRLAFCAAEDGDEVLYSEQTPIGQWSVVVNTRGAETNVNMKMLFKAVIKNKQRIAALFRK